MADWTLHRVDASDEPAIAWIARGMRLTLEEVEGPERGAAMYSDEWRTERVRWHLDPARSRAAVWVARDADGAIGAHTIVREERRDDGTRYGLISTTWVDPAHRREGLARRLLAAGESWFREQGLAECCTWTSSTNVKLIGLYAGAGYAEAERGPNDLTGTLMVRLARRF